MMIHGLEWKIHVVVVQCQVQVHRLQSLER